MIVAVGHRVKSKRSEIFKEWAEKKGFKVYNCTRGGMLEVYPRKSLEEVLK